jgi:hypothetical protein
VNSPKKILFVSGNIEHLYQFVIHGFFEELAETSSVYLTMPEQDFASERWVEISNTLVGVFEKVSPYRYSGSSRKSGYQLGAAATYRFRRQSSGYRGRIIDSLFGGQKIPIDFLSFVGFQAIASNLNIFGRRLLLQIPAMVRAIRPIFWLWSKYKTWQIVHSCSIDDIVGSIAPDVVVILMQRQAGFVIAAIASGEKFKIPTLLIPYKWDNASSKSPLIRTPTKMLVYNTAIKEVCERLHKMPADALAAVGSVEVGRGDSLPNQSKGNLIPLIGASTNIADSFEWIDCVDSQFCDRSFIATMDKYQAILRPYPNQSKENLKLISDFVVGKSRIRIDADILTGQSHRSDGVSFVTVRDSYYRYIALLDSAVLVISEGTSAIIDARARGVPVIFPAFKKNTFIGSQWFYLNWWEHMKGLRQTTGVFIAEDENELKRLVIDFLQSPRKIPPDNSGQNIFVDERTYAQRVLDVIDDAIAEKSKQRD